MSKDIDFDELDKAVSSLMGSVSKTTTDETPEQKTLTIAGTLKPDEKPAHTKLDEVAKKIGSEAIVTDTEQTLVAQDFTEPEIKEIELGQVAAEQSVEPPKPAQPLAPRPAGGRFMDVVHPSSDMRSADVPQNQVVSQMPVQDTAQVAPIPPPVVEAPLTPFLPDAKVEKRPLGGSTTTAPSPADIANSGFGSASPAQETVSINSEAPLKKLEGGDQPVLNAASFEEPTPAEAPELVAIESVEVSEPVALTNAAVASVESGDTEKLTTAQPTDKSGTIYDVANQPQSLSHPQKQKSGWGIVIIILVIIVFAAALGAAAYFILGLGV